MGFYITYYINYILMYVYVHMYTCYIFGRNTEETMRDAFIVNKYKNK